MSATYSFSQRDSLTIFVSLILSFCPRFMVNTYKAEDKKIESGIQLIIIIFTFSLFWGGWGGGLGGWGVEVWGEEYTVRV